MSKPKIGDTFYRIKATDHGDVLEKYTVIETDVYDESFLCVVGDDQAAKTVRWANWQIGVVLQETAYAAVKHVMGLIDKTAGERKSRLAELVPYEE